MNVTTALRRRAGSMDTYAAQLEAGAHDAGDEARTSAALTFAAQMRWLAGEFRALASTIEQPEP